MSEEKYYLQYPATEIDRRLKAVDDIPTKTSELKNDSGFITKADIPAVEIPENVATLEDVAKKQDIILDLESIRRGAELGATAIQEVKTINGQSVVGKGNIIINVETGEDLYIFNWDGETESGELSQEEYDKLVGAKRRAIKFDTNIIFATAEEYREDGSVYFIGQFLLGNYILVFDASFTPTSYGIYYEFKSIPRSTSELENDSGFVDETQLAKKQDKLVEGDGISIEGNVISCIHDKTLYKVVTELPMVGEEHKIYLVVSTDPEENNIYNEYAYINGAWEMLGTYKATIDLEPYAKKEDIPTDVVKYTEQELTDEEKKQARTNIGAENPFEFYQANDGWMKNESIWRKMNKFIYTPYMISSNSVTNLSDEILNDAKTNFFTEYYWNYCRLTGGEPVKTTQWKNDVPYKIVGMFSGKTYTVDFSKRTVTPD